MKFSNRSKAKDQIGVSYLGSINSSAKLEKNKKVSDNYTYILYLAPHNLSGYNVCKHSTPECRMGCLYGSGRVKIENHSGQNTIQKARIRKTKLFFEDQDFFMAWMIAEMKAYQEKAKRDGYAFSARLNGTSDIEWENVLYEGKTIFQHFPDVQFYDYTKNGVRMVGDLPSNYHLTYSYTGRNDALTTKVLNKGLNVAVIFNKAKFPETFMGFPVINGDLTDYRPLDGEGVVVGLKYKKLADNAVNEKLLESCFVVNA